MMKNRTGFFGGLILILIAALVYLPLIRQIGYTHDDWYLMTAAQAEGPSVFWDIFSVDRPYRALVMIPAYSLFGPNPLYYNLNAYLFRVAGALTLFWILKMLWPRQSNMTMLAALLFLIYPGFLSQPNAIDYQSHIVGLAAALLSVAFTVKAVLADRVANRLFFHALSILPGWLALGQIEWYIGFEFFRWACVFLLSSRSAGSLFQRGWRAVQWAYTALAIPGAFLAWRLFFFHGERGATDVDLQFSQFGLYPLQTLYRWTIQVAQDFLDVTLSAWVIPLTQLTGHIQRWGGLLAVLGTGLTVFVLNHLKEEKAESELQPFDFNREALLLGFSSAIGGLIPIAMVNREVWFPAFSRYSLVSSVGVAILIPALLLRLNGNTLRNGITTALCLIAMLTHHANSVKYVQEAAITRNFWWQVAWRVPQFEKNTTLMANVPGVATEEDYFVWGPASLIYYPENQNPEGIQPGLFAAVLNRDTVLNVLTRERQEFDNRKNIITYKNYRNIVVLSQPTQNSCVHVLDGNRPEFARAELDAVRVIGPFSEIEHVLADEAPHSPPEIVFGPEPAHGWCYYYQMADLARQKGEWGEVIQIRDQASRQNLVPTDLIEWMPFLQAYAQTRNIDRLVEVAPAVTSDRYIALQACRILNSMPGLSPDATEAVASLYCLE